MAYKSLLKKLRTSKSQGKPQMTPKNRDISSKRYLEEITEKIIFYHFSLFLQCWKLKEKKISLEKKEKTWSYLI